MALEDLNPTTRCYPRRIEDAFKDDIANAQWFYPPEKSNTWSNLALGGLGLCMWVGIAYLLTNN